jgi:hypothetical protein
MLVRRAARTLVALAFGVAACGGLVQPTPEADDSAGPADAGPSIPPAEDAAVDAAVDASLAPDSSSSLGPDGASSLDADSSGRPAWCASFVAAERALAAIASQVEMDGSIPSPVPVGPGVWALGGRGIDPWPLLIGFFRSLDVSSCAADLPSASDCSVCQQVATCTYDVTDPAQVQQSTETGEFVGPDGNEWVYAYVPSVNAIVIAEESLAPTTDVDLIVFYNEAPSGVDPNRLGCVPECGCEPG